MGASYPVHARLEACANSLKSWATKEFGEIKSMIKRTKKKLIKVQRQSPDDNMIAACSSMSTELEEPHRVNEAYWHIRSRVNDLRDGDKNTKYFEEKKSNS